MTDLRVVTTEGTDAILEEATVQKLADSLRGPLLGPGEGSYDEARKVWNGMIDRRPALIARCAGVADVIAAVRFARTHELLLAVRGGGHNITGNAVCEGGLMIDLSPMKSVRVDPVKRIARAEAGLTRGGCLGGAMGKHGLSCDNLLSADIVTADGQFLTASGEQNPDLFWGLRGGGGNFGVVTSFEYQLHPVKDIFAGIFFFPIERAGDVLAFYRDYVATAPEEMGLFPAFQIAPP